MSPRFFGIVLAILVSGICNRPLEAAGGKHLQVADFLEYEGVAEPQVSPDGRQVIYTRRWVDRFADRAATALWIMNMDGSKQRFLVEGGSARWAPDGERILYIGADERGRPQIFVRYVNDAGPSTQVTQLEAGPSSPVWSPDGRTIAFVAIVPTPAQWQIDLPPAPNGASWVKPPRIVDRLHYRQDEVGFRDPGYTHLFVVDAIGGTARQLTRGDWNVGARYDGLIDDIEMSWTPDGRRIVFDGLKAADSDSAFVRSDVFMIDVASAQLQQLTHEAGFWHSPVVSHDGKKIAYLGYPMARHSYQLPRIYVMDSAGKGARLLNAGFDEPPATLYWDARDAGVYFTAENRGYLSVLHMSLSGDTRMISADKTTLTLQSVDRSGRVGVGVGRSFYEPGDVHSFSLESQGKSRRLTAVNDTLLRGIELGKQEEISYETADGTAAQGWIIKPPGFDPAKKYPLLLEIHGGPFAMYVGSFRFDLQVFASNQFVVLYTNPRGSTGYGERFSQAIDRAYPGVDYLDLMSGVDAVLRRGYVDQSRLYVDGCSGGGALASWIIGQTDRFAAATVRCPVVDWLSMAGTSDIPGFAYALFDRPFWEDATEWLQRSPLMHVGNVRTPTVIMTGEQDMRTPISQSEEYYAALKMRGVPTKLLRFNDQYHGTGDRPSNYMRTMLYMMSWYNRFTLDSRSPPKGEAVTRH